MKKNILIVIIVLALLAIPVTVYAYSNDFTSPMDFVESYRSRGYGMHRFMDSFHYEYMDEMMEQDFNNEEEFNKYIDELKNSIQEKVNKGEITQEEADESIANIDAMVEFHNTHHQENQGRRAFGCH